MDPSSQENSRLNSLNPGYHGFAPPVPLISNNPNPLVNPHLSLSHPGLTGDPFNWSSQLFSPFPFVPFSSYHAHDIASSLYPPNVNASLPHGSHLLHPEPVHGPSSGHPSLASLASPASLSPSTPLSYFPQLIFPPFPALNLQPLPPRQSSSLIQCDTLSSEKCPSPGSDASHKRKASGDNSSKQKHLNTTGSSNSNSNTNRCNKQTSLKDAGTNKSVKPSTGKPVGIAVARQRNKDSQISPVVAKSEDSPCPADLDCSKGQSSSESDHQGLLKPLDQQFAVQSDLKKQHLLSQSNVNSLNIESPSDLKVNSDDKEKADALSDFISSSETKLNLVVDFDSSQEKTSHSEPETNEADNNSKVPLLKLFCGQDDKESDEEKRNDIIRRRQSFPPPDEGSIPLKKRVRRFSSLDTQVQTVETVQDEPLLVSVDTSESQKLNETQQNSQIHNHIDKQSESDDSPPSCTITSITPECETLTTCASSGTTCETPTTLSQPPIKVLLKTSPRDRELGCTSVSRHHKKKKKKKHKRHRASVDHFEFVEGEEEPVSPLEIGKHKKKKSTPIESHPPIHSTSSVDNSLENPWFALRRSERIFFAHEFGSRYSISEKESSNSNEGKRDDNTSSDSQNHSTKHVSSDAGSIGEPDDDHDDDEDGDKVNHPQDKAQTDTTNAQGQVTQAVQACSDESHELDDRVNGDSSHSQKHKHHKKHKKHKHKRRELRKSLDDASQADSGQVFCWEFEGSPIKKSYSSLRGSNSTTRSKSIRKDFFTCVKRTRVPRSGTGDCIDQMKLKVGDCALFCSADADPTDPDDERLPYIGRIESFWREIKLNAGNQEKNANPEYNLRYREDSEKMMLKVIWYYHAAEAITKDSCKGSLDTLLYPEKALFKSTHCDINDVQTIASKCTVLPFSEFKTSDKKNKKVYYLAGRYDPMSRTVTYEKNIPLAAKCKSVGTPEVASKSSRPARKDS